MKHIYFATKGTGTSECLWESKYDRSVAEGLSMFSDLDARSVWAALSYSNRLFLLFFCGVSFHTL
jgi:hypothetical protein